MSVQTEHAAAVNAGSPSGQGFDAFEFDSASGHYVLCDGANSCVDGGLAARWLARALAGNFQADTTGKSTLAQVMLCHEQMQQKFPEAGSTFVRVAVGEQGVELSGVGDSFIWLFRRRWLGWGPWALWASLPRHLDTDGNPSQMVGSEVCDQVHVLRALPRGDYYAVMMSDGPGAMISVFHILQRLQILGSRRPSSEDLDYVCRALAQQAIEDGCADDVTVALVWVRFDRS